MSFFKIRPCINSEQEAELVILKLFLRSAVKHGSCLSYRERMFLNIHATGYHILRPGNPETVIEVPLGRPGDAVDRFIDGFVYETGSSLGDIIIHQGDLTTAGLRWWFIQEKDETIKTLLGRRHFSSDPLLFPSPATEQTQDEHNC